jgi:hypothetical protein
MRRILVLVTVAALAIGAAESAFGAVPVMLRTPGAEFVELSGGNGRAVVARRGYLFVAINSGRLRLVDLPGAGLPNLSQPCRQRARRVSATTIEISGRNIGCRIWSGADGGPWQAIMRGRGISASGTVRGSLTLDAANTGPAGRFRIAGGEWRQWPRRARTFELNRK